ncbi:MAG: histidinol-phosphatase [Chloroflexi bacterium]|nr:histidinol-phosphatase [Chloroflexota bacterium]MDA1146178.1 histidinol-phosphatase [Chloroflexota bacterium]
MNERNDQPDSRPWRVSMHGGHSSEGSSHGRSTLTEILETAVARGMVTYGVSNHAPPSAERFLYDDERAAGLDLAGRRAQFEVYAAASAAAVDTFAGRLEVLRGFEMEVVPTASYVTEMQELRQRHGFDYAVGSVHHVEELPIDVSPALFDEAAARCGGLEGLLVRYYQRVTEMVIALRPEVVAHFDLPRLFAEGDPAHAAAGPRTAASEALRVIADQGALLEVNTAGFRKGLRGAYPAPWVVEEARDLGIALTFSDDSHHVDHVAADLEKARAYLLAYRVRTIGSLGRATDGLIERREIPL